MEEANTTKEILESKLNTVEFLISTLMNNGSYKPAVRHEVWEYWNDLRDFVKKMGAGE